MNLGEVPSAVSVPELQGLETKTGVLYHLRVWAKETLKT